MIRAETFLPGRGRRHGVVRAASCVTIALVLAGCLGISEPAAQFATEEETLASFLSTGFTTTLTVRVAYAPGREPTQMALDGLLEELGRATQKPVIDLAAPVEVPARAPADGSWSYPELVDALEGTLGFAPEARRGAPATLHVLYLPGSHRDAEGDLLRGLALSGTVFVFPDMWRTDAPDVSRAEWEARNERAVLVHEAGHVLGLVDMGVPMVRSRLLAGHHSSNPLSVMALGSRAVEDGESFPYRFDDDDLLDLRTFAAAYEAKQR